MRDSKEFILFFEEGQTFNSLNVARDIVDRFKYIGNPIILPENQNLKSPVIIFQDDEDFRIQVSRSSVSVVLSTKHYKELASIIFDIVDVFYDNKCSFNRLGCITSVFLNSSYVEKAKSIYLKDEIVDEEIENYNLSFYRKIKTKYGYINAWHRLITDKVSFNELLIQFDFNSMVEDKIDIDMKYIKEFIKVTDEFIERKVDF